MRRPLQAEIGRRLREVRRARGLTQKALAQRTEGSVDYSYIGKVERGEQLPSLKLLQRLGRALHVPVGYFFEEQKGRGKGPVAPEVLRALATLHPDDLPLLLEILRVLGRRRQQAVRVRGRTLPRVAEAETAYRRDVEGVRESLEEVIHVLRRPGVAGLPEVAEALEAVERAWRRLHDAEGRRGPSHR